MITRSIAVAVLLAGYCAITSAQDIVGFVDENDYISLSSLNGPANIVGVDFKSPGGFLVPTEDPTPWDIVIAKTNTRVTLGNLASSVTIDGTVTTDVQYIGTSPQTDLDAKFGSGVTEIGFPVIPEPSTFCLTGLALLGALGVRRRR